MAHGDFDNDGYTDLACGNPHDAPQGRTRAGSIHVFYGQPGGWPPLIDLKRDALPSPEEMRVVKIDGGQAFDTLCYSASAGFIDADANEDLIVNEMTGNGFGGTPLGVGNLVIIRGAALGSAPTTELVYSPSSILDFGSVQIGQSAIKTVTISHANLQALSFIQWPAIVRPEGASFVIAIVGLVSSSSVNVEITFTPTTAGPFGAAVSARLDGESLPVRVGLRGIGVAAAAEPYCELDFYEFGGNELIQFRSRLGIDYDGQRSIDLNASGWVPLASDLPSTGGLIRLFDPTVMPLTERAFYRILEQ
ncbi:MAG: hypothetical protein ACI9DF_005177 [Verrucomicrobiales bacterium]|jgi:hypothetical protein